MPLKNRCSFGPIARDSGKNEKAGLVPTPHSMRVYSASFVATGSASGFG